MGTIIVKGTRAELEELLVELRETQDRMLVQAACDGWQYGTRSCTRDSQSACSCGTELLADEMGDSSEIPAAVKLIERGIERIESIVNMSKNSLRDGRRVISTIQIEALESTVEIVRLFSLSSGRFFELNVMNNYELRRMRRSYPAGIEPLLNASRASRIIRMRVSSWVSRVQREGRRHVDRRGR